MTPPDIAVLSIAFNHDASSATGNAINVRRTLSLPVEPPEWRAGITHAAQDSVAAYAISALGDGDVTVRVRLATRDPRIASAEVRAIAPLPCQLPAELLWWLLRPLVGLDAGPAARASALARAHDLLQDTTRRGNVLGELSPRRVVFGPDGVSGDEDFQLAGHRLPDVGVGAHRQIWRWQCRLDEHAPWSDFALTQHRIYTLLGVPTAPWQQQPFTVDNVELPWTRVLDYACRWARGARTTDDAAAAITRAVYALGDRVFQYDCVGAGASHYTSPVTNSFDCRALLERLDGGIGLGSRVDCADCAAIVSTFANALGCDLWQSRMGMLEPYFEVNPILAIGSPKWDRPCGHPGFYFHEVAWTGDCSATDRVYDACLAVDGELPSGTPPFRPVIPTGMRFGVPGSGDYLDYLVPASSRAICAPQPRLRIRRSLVCVAGSHVAMHPEVAQRLRDRLDLEHWPGSGTPDGTMHLANFQVENLQLQGWRIHRVDAMDSIGDGPATVRSLWTDGPGRWLRLDSHECASRTAAHAVLTEILASFELPIVQRVTEPGSVAFATDSRAIVLACRGNLVFWLRAAGRCSIEVLPLARCIDRMLIADPALDVPAAQSSRSIRVGEELPLVDPARLRSGRRWKLAGDVDIYRRGGAIIARPMRPGRWSIDLISHAPGRRDFTRERLNLTVLP